MTPLRMAGFAFIVMAILMGMGDLYTILVKGQSLSLGDIWATISLGSLNGTQAAIERYTWSGLWWYGLYPILLAPAWLVLAMVGGILVALGGKEESQ